LIVASERGWQPPRNLLKSHLTVVACTPHYFGDDFVQPYCVPEEWGGPLHCDSTSDLDRLQDADALWFHGPTAIRIPRGKSPAQPWILMSMESQSNYPFLRDHDFLDLFDLHMTYRRDSDIPALYPNRRDYDDFMTPPVPTSRKGNGVALALYIASNPVARRDEHVRELSRHISVDAPGKCLTNQHIEGFIDGDNSRVRKGSGSILAVLPPYKFYLAFEQSISTDYVTEKILVALAAGVVPVYSSAPNIRDFLPADNAAVFVDDFKSPAELGAYLNHLDRDDAAYEAHLAWKRTGYRANFKELLDVGDIDSRYRLALKLAHGCERSCRCGGRLLP